jgi:hypothetical protein
VGFGFAYNPCQPLRSYVSSSRDHPLHLWDAFTGLSQSFQAERDALGLNSVTQGRVLSLIERYPEANAETGARKAYISPRGLEDALQALQACAYLTVGADGSWLLFHIGADEPAGCEAERCPGPHNASCAGGHGTSVARALSPYGPWQRVPYILPDNETNPSATVLPNGSIGFRWGAEGRSDAGQWNLEDKEARHGEQVKLKLSVLEGDDGKDGSGALRQAHEVEDVGLPYFAGIATPHFTANNHAFASSSLQCNATATAWRLSIRLLLLCVLL